MYPTQFLTYSPSASIAATEAVGATAQPAAHVPSVSTLMPEPAGPDIALAIAQMVIENAHTSRKQARESRQHANAAMVAAQKDQIAHMRAEANKRYEAARWEAFGKIGAGALGIAGGVIKANGAFGLVGAKSATGELTSAGAQARDGWGDAAPALGQVGSGLIGLHTSGLNRAADRENTAAKEAEMEASAQKDVIDSADEEIKDARDHIRTALDFLREFQSTEAKSMSSAIRG